MSMKTSLFEAMSQESPLQIAGVVNAYIAQLAKAAGFRAIYLSGAGVSNQDYALPDLGLVGLAEVCEQARRVTNSTNLPLLVDIDTGYGSTLSLSRAIKELENIGVAGVHIEDQVYPKRCGHRDGKVITSTQIMQDRLKSALDTRINEQFMIIARTDSLAIEGIESAIERTIAYEQAGADAIFAEACQTLDAYKQFCDRLSIPVLANITEFGKTPLFTVEELNQAGVKLILYPLSAARAMNYAAEHVLKKIKSKGTQKSVLNQMETRESLYKTLDYYQLEKKLNDEIRS